MAIARNGSATVDRRRRLRPVSEAAGRLGVTVACLRSWIYERKIEYVKVGRAVRISDATIEDIIARGTVPARR